MNLSFAIENDLTMSWYYRAFIALIATGIISYLANLLILRLHKVFTKSNHPFRNIFLASVKPPLHFFIITLGLSIVVQIVTRQFEWTYQNVVGSFKIETIIASLFWFVLRVINKTEAHLIRTTKMKDSKLDRTSIAAISIVAKITFFAVAFLISMEAMGISISGILAFGSVSGIVVGFASKDMLANFFGAITIYLDRPFKIGDSIKLQEKGIEGIVEKIGIRCTIIRNRDKRPLYVPNSYFTQTPIENSSRMTHRLINEFIALRHEDFNTIPAIITDIKKMLYDDVSIDNKQTCSVNFAGFSTASANITILCYSKVTSYIQFQKVKERVLMEVSKIIISHKAQIAQAPINNINDDLQEMQGRIQYSHNLVDDDYE